MSKLWRVYYGYTGFELSEVEVTRFNDKSYWTKDGNGDEVRSSRDVRYKRYFDTRDEAVQYIKDRATRGFETAKRNLESARNEFDKAMEL